ncbi:MAG: hypothetical protein R2932_06085 [Caldilineaceae bacterium]
MSTSKLKYGQLAPTQLGKQLISHLSLPLYRNGYALLFSGVTSSGLGLVYWLLAARFYAPDVVGLNSALISAIMFLSGIALLGLNSLLTYFIPRAGSRAGQLIGYAYGVSALAALVAGAVFLGGIDFWAPELTVIVNSWLMRIAFAGAVLVMTIFTLQDSVLIGLRQSLWVPVENSLVGVTKVTLLIAMVSIWQHYGVTAAWLIPALLSLIPVNWNILRRFLPNHRRTLKTPMVGFSLREIRSHMAGNYIGGLFFLSSTTILPLIVTQVLGAEANAYFYMPWMITAGLHLIPQTMATSFTVEATHDGERRAEYFQKVVSQCLRLLLPLVLLVSLGAPYILAFFGAEYAAQGTTLLRILPWALLPNVFVAMHLSMARLQNRMRVVMSIQGAVCVLMLTFSYLFMQWWGIAGVGSAWLVAHIIVAVVIYAPKFIRQLKKRK